MPKIRVSLGCARFVHIPPWLGGAGRRGEPFPQVESKDPPALSCSRGISPRLFGRAKVLKHSDDLPATHP